MLIRYSSALWIFSVLTGCATVSHVIVSAVPSRDFEPERVSSAYDLKIKSLKPKAGKALIYVVKDGDFLEPDTSDIYLERTYMGRIWPGTYLFAMVNPGVVRIKATTQVRKEGFGWSRPDWYKNSWGTIEIKPNNTYYIEHLNSDADVRLRLLGIDNGVQKIKELELDLGNEHDRAERGYKPRTREPLDICPFGSSIPQGFSPQQVQEWDLSCKFEMNF